MSVLSTIKSGLNTATNQGLLPLTKSEEKLFPAAKDTTQPTQPTQATPTTTTTTTTTTQKKTDKPFPFEPHNLRLPPYGDFCMPTPEQGFKIIQDHRTAMDTNGASLPKQRGANDSNSMALQNPFETVMHPWVVFNAVIFNEVQYLFEIAKEKNCEAAVLLVTSDMADGQYPLTYVHDWLMIGQDAGSVRVELDGDHMEKVLKDQRQRFPDFWTTKPFKNLIHVHLHPGSMGVSPSGTDVQNESLRSELGFKYDHQIFGIHNNNNDALYRMRRYRPKWDPEETIKVSLALHYPQDVKTALNKDKKEEIKQLLEKYHRASKPSYTSTYTYSPQTSSWWDKNKDKDTNGWPPVSSHHQTFHRPSSTVPGRTTTTSFKSTEKPGKKTRAQDDPFFVGDDPTDVSSYLGGSTANINFEQKEVEKVAQQLLTSFTTLMITSDKQIMLKSSETYNKHLYTYLHTLNPMTDEPGIFNEADIEDLAEFTLAFENHILFQKLNENMAYANLSVKDIEVLYLNALFTIEHLAEEHLYNMQAYPTPEAYSFYVNDEYGMSPYNAVFSALAKDSPLETEVISEELYDIFMEIA